MLISFFPCELYAYQGLVSYADSQTHLCQLYLPSRENIIKQYAKKMKQECEQQKKSGPSCLERLNKGKSLKNTARE